MDILNAYPGAIPLDTDVLAPGRFAVQGVGTLAQLVMGSGSCAMGLGCAPASSGLGVVLASGSLLQMMSLAPIATGALPADATPCVQQGINTQPITVGLSGSGTWYVYGAISIAPGGSVVLPYYNAANPAQTFAGVGNSGQPNYTQTQARVALAATTGSIPSGSVLLYTVTVPSGAAVVTQAMIVPAGNPATGPFFPTIPQIVAPLPIPVLFEQQGAWSYTVPFGVTRLRIRGVAPGGSGGAATTNGDGAGGGGAGAGIDGVANVSPGDVISGSNGVPGPYPSNPGGFGFAGTSSTITVGAQTVTLNGGGAGVAASTTGTGGGGAGGLGGTVVFAGTNGNFLYLPITGGAGGDGTGAIKGSLSGNGGMGGCSMFGGGGRGGTTGGTGNLNWGTGSGGGYSTYGTGGSGAGPGVFIIEPCR